MDKHWSMDYLGIMVDMAGCPNRCRHCWLGSHKNGSMTVDAFREIAEQFKCWRDANGNRIRELGFFSWWREPDFCDDYRELWALEQELSSPGRATRFELLSTWRLARDEGYAKWASTIGPPECQISFFGMEDSTDWGYRRKGAFRDQLIAAQRCLEAGIAPQFKLFESKRCLNELGEFVTLMKDLKLQKRCQAIGQVFSPCMAGVGMSPEGSGFEMESERLEENDLQLIPQELFTMCHTHIDKMGVTEQKLIDELLLLSTA